MPQPAGLAPDDLARLLAKVSGFDVTSAMIAADLAAGAPANLDGSVNFLSYVAWLLKQGRDA